MDISIIIVNWNTEELLRQCLNSIFAYPFERTIEVWVIDNSSVDDSIHMVKENFPQVKLKKNEKNLGFARANNQALRLSSGEFVLLLNPDTIVKPNAIEKLVKFLESTPKAGGAGSRLLNPDGSLQESAYPQPTLFREFWRMFHLDNWVHSARYPSDYWSLDQPIKVDVLMGACLLIRREALDVVGFFDEEYFIYSEEVDLCTRLNHAGWDLYWVPNAEVIHFGGQSTQQVAEEMFLRLYEGKILYFRKHHSNLEVMLYKLILFIATLARLALTPIAYLESSAKRREHLDLSQNYRRLLWEIPSL
jgi:GT2 family glycosyltransferase